MSQETLPFTTIMKTDYVNWKEGVPERMPDPTKLDAGLNRIPFAGKSSYKATYLNWGAHPVSIERGD